MLNECGRYFCGVEFVTRRWQVEDESSEQGPHVSGFGGGKRSGARWKAREQGWVPPSREPCPRRRDLHWADYWAKTEIEAGCESIGSDKSDVFPFCFFIIVFPI